MEYRHYDRLLFAYGWEERINDQIMQLNAEGFELISADVNSLGNVLVHMSRSEAMPEAKEPDVEG